MKNDSRKQLDLIAEAILDKKGFNILALDIKNVSTFTDYIVIAEGNVDRHVLAIANSVIAEMKQEGYIAHHIEGREGGDWVVIDYVDIIVHLFMPGLRTKYQLERLWEEGTEIDLDLDLTEEG